MACLEPLWFGWAQEKPPEKWRIGLGIGALLSLAIMGMSIYLAIKNWSAPSALTADQSFGTFGIVVATEVALIVAGAITLSLRGKSQYLSSWIAFIVAAHFIPLVYIFHDPWLWLLVVLTVAASLVPIGFSKKVDVSVVTLTGLLMGSCLIIFALRNLVLFLAHS